MERERKREREREREKRVREREKNECRNVYDNHTKDLYFSLQCPPITMGAFNTTEVFIGLSLLQFPVCFIILLKVMYKTFA